ncbi:sensor histidine kinase [Streptomyces sp. NBC_00091]|uniref:sensor histidine kinase n=1 Tax=Streptomyces sp. NBC_00091 TaxID=2975648 RepID=UPI0022546970|nr:histidine kinase [Streptomyces sp. NBC_00091]MCX5377374.1 histidine kinase [Streptomyces sp. NBC_00091]
MIAAASPDTFERWFFKLMTPVGRSQWLRADLLMVGLVALGALHCAFRPDAGLVSGTLPSAAVALVVTAGFLCRRRAPLPVALLTMAGLVLNGARTPVFFALYGLARYQRGRRTAVIALGSAAFVPLKALLPGHLGTSVVEDFLNSAFYVVLPVVFGLGANAYERSITALRAEREHRIRQTRSEERLRLSREMHDILGHRIAIIAMHAGAIEFVPGVKPESRKLARAAGDTARAAMRDLRQVLGALRDGEGSVVAGRRLADLDALVGEARAAGLAVTFDRGADGADGADEADDAVPPEIALTAYRTVQEALTNVVKHAPGARTAVRIHLADGVLSASVHNEPPARHVRSDAAGCGFGMIGLRERVSLLDGEFQAGPTPDGGWRVVMTVPTATPDRLSMTARFTDVDHGRGTLPRKAPDGGSTA